MAMTTGPGASDDMMVDINTTPLIDVMLVLLIMFIITIPIQTHALKLQMPATPPSVPPPPPQVVRITIAADGSLRWNDEPVADRAALQARLATVAALAEQPSVHVRPDRRVAYRYVAAVLASAQRAGVTKIGMEGNERFAQ